MKELIIVIYDKCNLLSSSIVAFLTSIFGMQWGLFFAYLLLNIIDYITGIVKAKRIKKENSNDGIKGIFKKVYYWLIIFTTFIISYMLIEICKQVNVNIEFVMFFGWFTLGCFAINEARSIIENLVECGVRVPNFLIKGLEAAENKFQNIVNDKIEKKKSEDTIEK